MNNIIFVILVFFGIIACSQLKTSDSHDLEQIKKAGITNIKFQSEPLKNIKCGSGVESKYFTGKTKLGQEIGGVLCKGKLKQTTLRF